ncbi:secreted RxLR effector protein 161-like [Vicia villosa]|uniref:secreted RxLR effector protein 161-like n=1 Tax=Vicia villosa TaxID=3911 RepID=UPI00273AD691|nr:secreted RxLR effector protein 161-like [Vicia villosa]
MGNCNGVKNSIVPGSIKLSKAEEGKQVDGTLFKQMVGSLMYMTTTSSDLMYCVCLFSRFISNPKEVHMLEAKRILRYIKSIIDLGIFYWKGCRDELVAYTNNGYACDIDDRKSTSGYLFMLSGGVVAWASKKRPVVTLSTTKDEYVEAASTAFQCIWMQHILKQIKGTQSDCIILQCSAIILLPLSLPRIQFIMGEVNT